MDAPAAPRVFISAAEQSADEHAAAFIRASHKLLGPIDFEGLAGPAMREAGCECFHDMTAKSAMALKAIGRVPEALLLMNRLAKHLSTRRFDAAVLVDSPTLHLPMSRLFRARGIPRFVLHRSADLGLGALAQRADRPPRHPHGLHLAV